MEAVRAAEEGKEVAKDVEATAAEVMAAVDRGAAMVEMGV